MPSPHKTAKPKKSATHSPKTTPKPAAKPARAGGANLAGGEVPSQAALALAARMIQQTPDPEAVARDLGMDLAQAAETLIRGSKVLGPIGGQSLALIGRILRADWAGPRTAAGGTAERNAAILGALEARLNVALDGDRPQVRHDPVTAGGEKARKLPF